MSYKPTAETQRILDAAWDVTNDVDYAVTARWVFYRLLQAGIYDSKAGYKHLLGILSKARKEFYGQWRPYTLADDSRGAILMQRGGYYTLYMRGQGFEDEEHWRKTLNEELNCPLDRWTQQPVYVELWFEAAAMQGQFLRYANENVPLLAFHGDISIPEKWRAADRLANWWIKNRKPIHIYYYGDYDPKGLVIPNSAWEDIRLWAAMIISAHESGIKATGITRVLNFHRVGINKEDIERFNIQENPERPGTYQWEALDDTAARALIHQAEEKLSIEAFDRVKDQEKEILDHYHTSLNYGTGEN